MSQLEMKKAVKDRFNQVIDNMDHATNIDIRVRGSNETCTTIQYYVEERIIPPVTDNVISEEDYE